MAILKSAARKVAEKTVINTVVGKNNITNLNNKKARTLSNLSKDNPATTIVKSLINSIEEASINGKVLYKTGPYMDLYFRLALKLLSKKRYAVAHYKVKTSNYMWIYWGPNKKLMKARESNEKSKPKSIDITDESILSSLTIEEFKEVIKANKKNVPGHPGAKFEIN